jgi:gluconokinase
MGVSGSGKTTVGRHLARRTGWAFADADDLHPAANIEKMRAGTPLDEADRRPWLDAVRAWIAARQRAGVSSVVACSALRRSHRDQLRAGGLEIEFVHLRVPVDESAARMRSRPGHFMPTGLAASQFQALEALAGDEWGTAIDATASVDVVSAEALTALARLPHDDSTP